MKTFDDRELRRRVDEVLYYIWDPIGVSPEPCARAEYDSYIPKVFQLVTENDQIEPISEYLVYIEEDYMELIPNEKRCDETAKLLLEHKKAIQQHRA